MQLKLWGIRNFLFWRDRPSSAGVRKPTLVLGGGGSQNTEFWFVGFHRKEQKKKKMKKEKDKGMERGGEEERGEREEKRGLGGEGSEGQERGRRKITFIEI